MSDEVKNLEQAEISKDTLDVAAKIFNKGKDIVPKKEKVVKEKVVEKKAETVVEAKTQEIIETPFFKIVQDATEKPIESGEINLSDWNMLVAYAKERNFEIKTPNDLALVFKAVEEKEIKIKEYEPKIEELENKTTSFEKLMINMPPEIANPFLAWTEGNDYKAEIRKIQEIPFDLTVSVEKQSDLELVNHFSDDKYTNDEWEDLDDKVKKNLSQSAKQLYFTKQHEFLSKRDKANGEKIEKQTKFNKSIDAAINKLKIEFPDMKETELKEIKQQMQGGINKTLFNDDGTYRETAAKQISMALYGEKTLGQLRTSLEAKMNAEKNKIISQTREDILIKSPDGTTINSGDDSKNKLEKLVQESTSFLKKVGKT